jgi:hypothetical protein
LAPPGRAALANLNRIADLRDIAFEEMEKALAAAGNEKEGRMRTKPGRE